MAMRQGLRQPFTKNILINTFISQMKIFELVLKELWKAS
jgi:hypothetical protein